MGRGENRRRSSSSWQVQAPQKGGRALHRAEAWLPVCLTQEKLATKVRKKEITIRNLTTECERIRAKQALDELTAGQASTLARNERTIDLLKEEVRTLIAVLLDIANVAAAPSGARHIGGSARAVSSSTAV